MNKNLDSAVLAKINALTEEFFATENDPDQMPVTQESFDKLQRLHPQTIVYKLVEGEPVSWVVVVPTAIEVMEKFLRGEISERQLLDMSEPREKYEALYLCSAFTLPAYRRKGYATAMFQEAIAAIPHVQNVKLFAWAFTHEGEMMIQKLSKKFGVDVLVRR